MTGDVLVGAIALVLSALVNAAITGALFGGMRSEMREFNRRLRAIESMFRLVPRQAPRHRREPYDL